MEAEQENLIKQQAKGRQYQAAFYVMSALIMLAIFTVKLRV